MSSCLARRVMGASGGAQVVVIGGHEIPVEELAVRNVMPDPQGMLGADTLRGTVLACAADPARRVFLQVPG
jgi:hypothetical protein